MKLKDCHRTDMKVQGYNRSETEMQDFHKTGIQIFTGQVIVQNYCSTAIKV